jgi:hypothetical protein
MKLTSYLALFSSLIIILSGCVTGGTKQPTQRSELLSPTIKSVTSTITPTLTLTPIATLAPQEITETLQPFLKDPMNCSVLCFWGIIPGKMRLDEVRGFFNQMGFTPFEGNDPNSGRDFYTIEYQSRGNADSSFTLYVSNGWIENIVVTPRIVRQKEGSPREWIAYSPETLIKKYGKPSRVEFAVDWGPNFVIAMTMYFDVSDLIVIYSGYNMIPDRPYSPRLCPLTAPFDDVRLWLGSSPPNPPFTGIALEKATSLTVDQFTQLMLGNPQKACFTLNGNAFR